MVYRDRHVLAWLLDKEQPAVRYYTLVDLLGRGDDDPDVKSAYSSISRVGWAADQLRKQGPKGFWEPREPKGVREWFFFLYFPKFHSTFWRALVLSELGLDATNPRIKRAAEVIFDYKLSFGSPLNFYYEEASVSGNTARMLTRFGYADDRRVQKLFDWLLEDQREDGGWNNSQGTPGSLDAWEPLAALASLPKEKHSRKMEQAIARGVEFYLERKLIGEGKTDPAWLSFHYPNHYYYDTLVGLDILTQLGFGGERRLRPALDILLQKRQADGTWLMGPPPPDSQKPKPLVIEKTGKPSKWITLKALRVLKRVEDAK